MSDVPLGAMLSGGLDSSLIVALMARNMSEPVKTFSVGFAEAGAGNELREARLVAEQFGCDHHELELSFHSHEVDLADLVWHLDEPLADLSSLGFLALSELASEHVTVALSGQGADELFGGYRKHRAAATRGAVATGSVGCFAARSSSRPPVVRDGSGGPSRTLAAGDPATRLLAMSGNIDSGGYGSGSSAGRSRSSTAWPLAGRSPHASTACRTIRFRSRSTSTRSSASSTTCSTTSIARRWPIRSRFASPSSTTTSSSSPPGFPARLKVQGTTTKAILKQSSARARARQHHRQAQDRFLQRRGRQAGSRLRRTGRSRTGS